MLYNCVIINNSNFLNPLELINKIFIRRNDIDKN